jgi:hypothetical protein
VEGVGAGAVGRGNLEPRGDIGVGHCSLSSPGRARRTGTGCAPAADSVASARGRIRGGQMRQWRPRHRGFPTCRTPLPLRLPPASAR